MSNEKRIKLSASCETADKSVDFGNKTKQTDIALVVEGKKLHVSKFILVLTSPVFEQMFNSGFKESNQDEVELPKKRYADVLEFLKCIYPGVIKPVTMKTVFGILPLAEEYLVHFLKEQCQQVLLANTTDKQTSAEDVCTYLSVAVTYKLKELQEKCVKLAGDIPGPVFRSKADKFNLPIEIQAAIYKDICLKQSRLLSSVQDFELDALKDNRNGKNLKKKLNAIPFQFK